jgi:hypothetical protein
VLGDNAASHLAPSEDLHRAKSFAHRGKKIFFPAVLGVPRDTNPTSSFLDAATLRAAERIVGKTKKTTRWDVVAVACGASQVRGRVP